MAVFTKIHCNCMIVLQYNLKMLSQIKQAFSEVFPWEEHSQCFSSQLLGDSDSSQKGLLQRSKALPLGWRLPVVPCAVSERVDSVSVAGHSFLCTFWCWIRCPCWLKARPHSPHS